MRSQKESLRRGEEKEELGEQETSPETARTHLCTESHPDGHCSALTVVPTLVHTFISLKHSILFDSLDSPRGTKICKLAALGPYEAYRSIFVTCRAFLTVPCRLHTLVSGCVSHVSVSHTPPPTGPLWWAVWVTCLKIFTDEKDESQRAESQPEPSCLSVSLS